MALAVRRVGGTRLGEQTYTLPANSRLRLDAVSFTIGWANEGNLVIPTLTAESKGGATVAEIAAPILQVTPPGLAGFTYSGPAVMTDDFSVLAPDGYTGYLLHDFGAAPVTSQLTFNWTQPPGLRAAYAVTWLRSPGAVSMGASKGVAIATNTDTITVELTASAAAGTYLLLHLDYIDPLGLQNPDAVPPPVVTGTVGGNQLDFSGHPTFGFSTHALQRADGAWLSSAVEFYRIVNPLSAGDTVTLTLPNGPVAWLTMNVHTVTGLTVGNPVGPNPGGNYIGFGSSSATSPHTTTFVPTPKFVGGALINTSYLIPTGGTVNVSLARGGVEILPLFATASQGSTTFVQAPLPELNLGPFDTLTIASQDTLNVRGGDSLSNFHVYGLD